MDRSYLEKNTDERRGLAFIDHVKNRYTITEDSYETSFAPWYVNIYGVIYESLSKFILECHQHGFTEYFERKRLSYKNTLLKNEVKVLTLHILSAGFYVWLVSVVIACISFLGEHVYFRLRDKNRIDLKKTKKKQNKQFKLLKI